MIKHTMQEWANFTGCITSTEQGFYLVSLGNGKKQRGYFEPDHGLCQWLVNCWWWTTAMINQVFLKIEDEEEEKRNAGK